jgi:MFS family permease
MHLHILVSVTDLETSSTAPPSSHTVVRGLAWSRATWALLVVLCGALFLDGLDLSMVGVALPSIGSDLHLSAGALQWIVSGYVLGYGSFLLLGGRASDLLGRRRVFLTAVAVFGITSVISATIAPWSGSASCARRPWCTPTSRLRRCSAAMSPSSSW